MNHEEDLDQAYGVISPFMQVTVSPARDEEGKTVEASEQFAAICMHDGDFEGAVAHYRRAIEQGGETAERWENLGAALEGSAQTEEAEQAYRTAWALEPRPETAIAMADLERGEGKLTAAYEWLARARACSPVAQQPFILLKEAEMRLASGLRTKASELARQAAVLADDSGDLWLRSAEMSLEAGASDEAVSSAVRARDLQPERAEAWIAESLAHAQGGQNGPALTAVRQALEIEPDRLDYRSILERLLRQGGHLEEADIEAAKITQIDRFDLDRFARMARHLEPRA